MARVRQLRNARDVKALGGFLRDHIAAPEWKVVAIRRAIKAAVMTASAAPPSQREEDRKL